MQGSRTKSESQPAILVADSSKVTLVAARKLLESRFQVYLAEDGEAAWELLESIPEIGAVFTDQNLPRLDGLALLARLRSAREPRLNEMPVIVITSGERNEALRQAAVEAGATDFILKPFDALDLTTRARAWCGSRQQAASLREQNLGLSQLVLLDADTRTGNRDYFLQEAVKDRSFCLRHGGTHALVYIKVDGTHEPAALRGIMATVAAAIRSKCRREDTVARVADDAFALSLLHTAPLNARVLAERIRLAVAEAPAKPQASISIGISTSIPDPNTPADDMLAAARKAALAAAKAGGNRVQVDPDAMQAVENSSAAPGVPVITAVVSPSAGDTPLINQEAALADPAAFVGEVLPVLQKLSDCERLVLIDRLLIMGESST